LLQEIIGLAPLAGGHGAKANRDKHACTKVRIPSQGYIDRLAEIANWKDRLRKKIARELWHPEGWPPAYDELREEID
jgi:hypothetical protein